VQLIFRREEIAGDSERVVFPDLGLSAELPSFTDVAVELPASDPGEHEFVCPTRALRGALVVEARPRGAATPDALRSTHRPGVDLPVPAGGRR
jgi:plastocyanin domain-containing protein